MILGLLSVGVANGQTKSNVPETSAVTCQAYSIPLAGVACPSGYTGTQFPMRTKSCPDGKVTDGLSYDTTNCRQAGTQPVDPNATNCTITPQAIGCVSLPTLKGCDIGKHWSLAGSGIAHCVADDFVCPWSQTLNHDALGNPFCVQNTCPVGQNLQSDGVTCACPGSTVWNGSACVVPCTPSFEYEYQSCSSGVGTMLHFKQVVCPGNTIVYGPWDTSGCGAACTPFSGLDAGTCPSGTTGTAYRSATKVCPSGSMSYGPYDYSTCIPDAAPPPSGSSCVPSSGLDAVACPSGTTGTAYRFATMSCPSGSMTYGSPDYSNCITDAFPPPSGSGSGSGFGPGFGPGAPTCSVSFSIESAACPAGYTGSQSRTVTQNCPLGTSYGGWDTSGCTQNPLCDDVVVSEAQACPSGMAGMQSRSVTTTCQGIFKGATSWDTSSCVPPPPPSCGYATWVTSGGLFPNGCQANYTVNERQSDCTVTAEYHQCYKDCSCD